jgi:hypothetical protein
MRSFVHSNAACIQFSDCGITEQKAARNLMSLTTTAPGI